MSHISYTPVGGGSSGVTLLTHLCWSWNPESYLLHACSMGGYLESYLLHARAVWEPSHTSCTVTPGLVSRVVPLTCPQGRGGSGVTPLPRLCWVWNLESPFLHACMGGRESGLMSLTHPHGGDKSGVTSLTYDPCGGVNPESCLLHTHLKGEIWSHASYTPTLGVNPESCLLHTHLGVKSGVMPLTHPRGGAKSWVTPLTHPRGDKTRSPTS